MLNAETTKLAVVCSNALTKRLIHHFATEDIDDSKQIQRSCPDWNVSHASHPKANYPGCLEWRLTKSGAGL